MTAYRIIKNLTKQGNAVLGVGVYSAALAANNGIDAIKIGTNIEDPWLDFKCLVIDQFTSNNHLPQIKSFYYDDDSEFFVCVMERLEAIKVDHKASELVEVCKEFVEGYYNEHEFTDIVKDYNKLVPNVSELIEVLSTIKKYTTHTRLGEQIDDNADNYRDRMPDFHIGNCMLRDEVLVITDPWCNADMNDVEDVSCWLEEELLNKQRISNDYLSR